MKCFLKNNTRTVTADRVDLVHERTRGALGAPFKPKPVDLYAQVAFVSRVNDVLDCVRYKSWTIQAYSDPQGAGAYLQVGFLAPDHALDRPGYANPVLRMTGRKWRLSEHMTKSEIVQTALAAVLAAEEHETREQFRYKGRAIFGPHFDVDGLHDICGRKGFEDKRPTDPDEPAAVLLARCEAAQTGRWDGRGRKPEPATTGRRVTAADAERFRAESDRLLTGRNAAATSRQSIFASQRRKYPLRKTGFVDPSMS
jgi:hypothetical protein